MWKYDNKYIKFVRCCYSGFFCDILSLNVKMYQWLKLHSSILCKGLPQNGKRAQIYCSHCTWSWGGLGLCQKYQVLSWYQPWWRQRGFIEEVSSATWKATNHFTPLALVWCLMRHSHECVAISHLFWGRQLQNVFHRGAGGRHCSGNKSLCHWAALKKISRSNGEAGKVGWNINQWALRLPGCCINDGNCQEDLTVEIAGVLSHICYVY